LQALVINNVLKS